MEIQLARLEEKKERVDRAVCSGEKAPSLSAQAFAQVASWTVKHLAVDDLSKVICDGKPCEGPCERAIVTFTSNGEMW